MIKESREKNRLLIADDSKMNRKILKEILGDEYIVTEAKDGTEAIELLKKEEDSFSALLLDLNMPETNGYQVLEWMNEEYVIERIPVIVILAEDNHENIEKAYELGAWIILHILLICLKYRKELREPLTCIRNTRI